MSIWKKAVSIGASAALTASLLATVAAPSVFASTSVTSAGAIAAGSTSTGTASFTFTENSAIAFNTTGTLTVTILDANSANTLTFSGGTLTAPGSLGASLSVSGNTFTVTTTGFDNNNVEQITVSGLKIAASTSAAAGAIGATLGGSLASAVLPGTATATGILQTALGAAAGTATVNVTSSCNFDPTNANGGASFSDATDTRNVTSVVFQSGTLYTIGFAAGTSSHPVSTTVTQTVNRCSSAVGSPGVVGAIVTQNASSMIVNPGQNNQRAGTTTAVEPSAGFLAAGQALTFTLPTGVLFSQSPAASVPAPVAILSPTGLVATSVTTAVPGSLPAGTYFYQVEASTAAGDTTPSAGVGATLSATGAVVLTWNAVAGATGYKVFGRPATIGGTYGLIATPTLTTYTDASLSAVGAAPAGANTATLPVPTGASVTTSQLGGTLPNATSYTYEITALNAAGETLVSAASNTVTTTSSTSSNTITWNAVAGATGYNVYQKIGAGAYAKLNTSPIAGTQFVDNGSLTASGAVPGSNTAVISVPTGLAAATTTGAGTLAAGTYYYKVTATNGAGETTPSSFASAAVPVNGAVSLTWTAVAGATGYKVYGRPASSGGTYGLLASVTTTSYTDTGAVTPGAVPPSSNTTAGTALTLTSSLCSLSFDRKSCTVTVNTASVGVPSSITIGNAVFPYAGAIYLDVAASVPAGTSITATLTGSPAFNVYVNSNVIAIVNRTLVGVGAIPTVWIGYNAQQSGVLTVSESAAGFFQAGTGSNNGLQICATDLNPSSSTPSETFTFAPWAVVTSGDLSLLNTSTHVGAASVQGTLNASATCAMWTVYSASTTASTITIVGATSSGPLSASVATNGPTLNINPAATPGPVNFGVGTGNITVNSSTTPPTWTFTPVYSTVAVNAMRAFKSGITVTALSQPYIAPGTIGAAGNIQVAETLNGQLVAGETFTCQLLQPNPGPNNAFWINTANSNDLPVVTTNTDSGLIAHLVPFPSGSAASSFSVKIDQQAYAPKTGVVTISNLHYQTATGSPLGPINVECFNASLRPGFVSSQSSFGADFDAFISNAIVGTAPTKTSVVIDNDSAVGQTQTGFSIVTKVVKAGSWVTIRFQTTPALAGKPLGVWIAKKNANGTWGAFSAHATVTANGAGVAYYFYKAGSPAWLSFRAKYAGDATFAASQSSGTQVRWN